jgi:hypothetical protein
MVLCYCLAHRPLRGSLKKEKERKRRKRKSKENIKNKSKWGNPKGSKRISRFGAVVVVVGVLFGCGLYSRFLV